MRKVSVTRAVGALNALIAKINSEEILDKAQLVSAISEVTGLQNDDLESQLEALHDKYQNKNIAGRDWNKLPVVHKLRDAIIAASKKDKDFDYLESGYARFVNEFEKCFELFRQSTEVGDFKLNEPDLAAEGLQYYSWSNQKTDMDCSVIFQSSSQEVRAIKFKRGDTFHRVDPIEICRIIRPEDIDYPQTESVWMSQFYGREYLGQLRHLSITLSAEMLVVTWDYNLVTQGYGRENNAKVPEGTPETIKGVTEVLGVEVVHTLDYEDTFRQLLEQSGFYELKELLQKAA